MYSVNVGISKSNEQVGNSLRDLLQDSSNRSAIPTFLIYEYLPLTRRIFYVRLSEYSTPEIPPPSSPTPFGGTEFSFGVSGMEWRQTSPGRFPLGRRVEAARSQFRAHQYSQNRIYSPRPPLSQTWTDGASIYRPHVENSIPSHHTTSHSSAYRQFPSNDRIHLALVDSIPSPPREKQAHVIGQAQSAYPSESRFSEEPRLGVTDLLRIPSQVSPLSFTREELSYSRAPPVAYSPPQMNLENTNPIVRSEESEDSVQRTYSAMFWSWFGY